jgi:hypothetical protein
MIDDVEKEYALVKILRRELQDSTTDPNVLAQLIYECDQRRIQARLARKQV